MASKEYDAMLQGQIKAANLTDDEYEAVKASVNTIKKDAKNCTISQRQKLVEELHDVLKAGNVDYRKIYCRATIYQWQSGVCNKKKKKKKKGK